MDASGLFKTRESQSLTVDGSPAEWSARVQEAMRAPRDRKSLKIQNQGKQPGIEVNEALGQVKGHFGKGMRWGTLTVTLAEETRNRTRLEVESIMEWTVWAKAGDTQKLLDEFLRRLEDRGSAIAKPEDEAWILLSSVGPKKVPVIKAIRSATGMGYKDAKSLVDNIPSRIEGLSEAQAEALASDLLRSDCKALVEQAGQAPTQTEVHAAREPDANAPDQADTLTQIGKLAELRDAGALTEEEFVTKKTELLNRI
jgi:ribosomal protein L7/L12